MAFAEVRGGSNKRTNGRFPPSICVLPFFCILLANAKQRVAAASRVASSASIRIPSVRSRQEGWEASFTFCPPALSSDTTSCMASFRCVGQSH